MKKIISCILILAIVFTLAQPVFAAQPPSIEPQYTNANKACVTLNISDSGKVKIVLLVSGKTGLKNTDVTTCIEKKVGSSWVSVEDWQYSTSSRTFSKTYEMQLGPTEKR